MMYDEFDPDRPIDGDPPFDAASMVDVIGEVQTVARARLAAAQDMIVPYAIRALLDGAPPREVAEACGFRPRPGVTTRREEPLTMVEQWLGMRMFEVQEPGVTTRDQFTKWLSGKLAAMIKDGWDDNA